MKRAILITSIILYTISTQICAQSSSESKSNDGIMVKTQLKKQLTPEDYKLWSAIGGVKISDNGNWYTYGLFYRHNTDTLFVGSIKGDKNYSFPTGKNGQFSPGGRWFACMVPKKGMALLDLEKDNLQWFSSISKFQFSSDSQYLVSIGKSMDSHKEESGLWIMNLALGKRDWIPGVTEFLLNPTSNNMAYIVDEEGKKAVVLRQLEQSLTNTTITENVLNNYKKLVWNSQGTALIFLEELSKDRQKQKRHRIYYYGNKQGRPYLKHLDPKMYPSIFPAMDITRLGLRLSKDGSTVFFMVQCQEDLEKAGGNPLADNVQIWGARDKRIYPKRERDRGWEYGPKFATWWPGKKKALLLETDNLPLAAVMRNGKHMLSYDPKGFGPHFEKQADIDLYVTDLETGQRTLFLQQHEQDSGHTILSPGGRYIAYFREKNWWVYDLEKRTHTNVTVDLGIRLYNLENAFSGALQPYGTPGWTNEDKDLVIYDQYDVWLISLTGKAPRRLTRGKESKVSHRIYRFASKDRFGQTWSGFDSEEFKLSEGLVFKTLGTDIASGYKLWKPETGLEELVYKDMYIDGLKKARSRDAYIYREQSFDTSPRLCYWEKGMKEPRILVESNPQQERFQWGTSELLRYKGPEGQQLQGGLFYPADYSPENKYPMIVMVYENNSKKLHHYKNPSEYLQDGWNPTNYTAEGYLVFYPDIHYKLSDPGISAVQCIEAGVMAVVSKGIVGEDRIGLIGHSWGGYETAFTITQTDLFATAVSGASMTDLVSFYHSICWDTGRSHIWRFEDGQIRFKDSFYENPAAYSRNSPLHHAANINTPLLLWTGEKDYWVDWHQSIEFYLALRRLDKECRLLVYPGEGHSIRNKLENQVDLTRRIKKWFNKYLKAEDKN